MKRHRVELFVPMWTTAGMCVTLYTYISRPVCGIDRGLLSGCTFPLGLKSKNRSQARERATIEGGCKPIARVWNQAPVEPRDALCWTWWLAEKTFGRSSKYNPDII